MLDPKFKAFVDSEVKGKMSEDFSRDAETWADAKLKDLGYEGAIAAHLRPLILLTYMEGQVYGADYMIGKITKGMSVAA